MHFAKGKKPDTKGNILYGSIYMVFWHVHYHLYHRGKNYRDRKQVSGCQEIDWVKGEHEGIFWGDETVLWL